MLRVFVWPLKLPCSDIFVSSELEMAQERRTFPCRCQRDEMGTRKLCSDTAH